MVSCGRKVHRYIDEKKTQNLNSTQSYGQFNPFWGIKCRRSHLSTLEGIMTTGHIPVTTAFTTQYDKTPFSAAISNQSIQCQMCMIGLRITDPVALGVRPFKPAPVPVLISMTTTPRADLLSSIAGVKRHIFRA